MPALPIVLLQPHLSTNQFVFNSKLFLHERSVALFLLLLPLPLRCICSCKTEKKLQRCKTTFPCLCSQQSKCFHHVGATFQCQVATFFSASFSWHRFQELGRIRTRLTGTNHRSLTSNPLTTRKRFGKAFRCHRFSAKLPSLLVPVLSGTGSQN
jgi:hypothetical protein